MLVINDFFMVKFDLEEDSSCFIDEGPWMILDHYLTVQCWYPEFVSTTTTIEMTMVWIHFSGLNLVFYNESILLALASIVG